MAPHPTIILFDLDGTLVDTGGAGRRALERAFAEQGAAAESLAFSFGGMTDRAILRQGLTNAGRAVDERAMAAIVARYLGHLEREVVAAREQERYRVLPGVERLLTGLEPLASEGAAAVGLGTGNVEPGAATKLAPANLMRFFAFGGYGSDAEDRGELLRIGARRGAGRLGRPLDDCRVLVIGDTPRDIAAARAIGARCLAVCTGHDTKVDLSSADHVVADLSAVSPEELVAL